MRHLSKFAITILCFSATTWVHAEWARLDANTSSVSFVSIKNKDIAEVHSFDVLAGNISDSGDVQVTIDAASVNTGIAIRDERMKEHLFAVVRYPNILISAQVDIDSINHGAQRVQLPASLSVLGEQYNIELDVLVTKHKTELTVSSAKPVLINATQTGFAEGVLKLAELAGGITIGNTVPVSFALSFKR